MQAYGLEYGSDFGVAVGAGTQDFQGEIDFGKSG
jgi:hypothetical protein